MALVYVVIIGAFGVVAPLLLGLSALLAPDAWWRVVASLRQSRGDTRPRTQAWNRAVQAVGAMLIILAILTTLLLVWLYPMMSASF